jgi:hypothetical protein
MITPYLKVVGIAVRSLDDRLNALRGELNTELSDRFGKNQPAFCFAQCADFRELEQSLGIGFRLTCQPGKLR